MKISISDQEEGVKAFKILNTQVLTNHYKFYLQTSKRPKRNKFQKQNEHENAILQFNYFIYNC